MLFLFCKLENLYLSTKFILVEQKNEEKKRSSSMIFLIKGGKLILDDKTTQNSFSGSDISKNKVVEKKYNSERHA